MRRSAWLVVIGMLSTGTVSAQATVIQPETPLDWARAGLRDVLLVWRDSLMTIDGAAARLQRDFRQTSGASPADFAAMSRPGEGETVRGYSYARSEVVQGAIRKYEENLREFFTALGIYVSPAGSNPRPTSG